jgi:hypothetical protein
MDKINRSMHAVSRFGSIDCTDHPGCLITEKVQPSIRTMKKNMGSADRIIRTIIAIVVGILYFTGQITGTTAIILGILAIVFLLTSFAGTCPLYLPFGLSTHKSK